jgi:hypothetical protein
MGKGFFFHPTLESRIGTSSLARDFTRLAGLHRCAVLRIISLEG